MWIVDPARLANVEGELDRKIEELAWAICVLYGVAGWTDMKLGGNDGKDSRFNADFFFMHLVTSSIFLPSLCAIISPTSQARLLKSYLMASLVWVVARGRPRLDIEGFVAATQDASAIPGLPESLKSKSDSDSVTGVDEESKIWSRILDEARVHQDEHLTKTIRALAGWAAVFGARKARGSLKGGDTTSTEANTQNVIPLTELPGSQYLDGGFFFRVAVLTLGRMGWDLEKGDQEERKEEGREGRGLC
ncbi:hypothetical protein NLJ89_g12090 [Agrocybe chaxingu]|uniref:Uncharacterized protein n=1 Tax=Agrocybe chaxingu TaxID=84603 RepID=A0A9W8JV37_9AGAR|nr:hypothetical protein NLJ89_g12090 [Agrocybe chaxingu]